MKNVSKEHIHNANEKTTSCLEKYRNIYLYKIIKIVVWWEKFQFPLGKNKTLICEINIIYQRIKKMVLTENNYSSFIWIKRTKPKILLSTLLLVWKSLWVINPVCYPGGWAANLRCLRRWDHRLKLVSLSCHETGPLSSDPVQDTKNKQHYKTQHNNDQHCVYLKPTLQ